MDTFQKLVLSLCLVFILLFTKKFIIVYLQIVSVKHLESFLFCLFCLFSLISSMLVFRAQALELHI